MKINTLKKITLLSLFLINVHLANAQGSVTPSELLTIAFEDATGARDTVYIGHYFDSCYLYINPPPTCPKIVSPNIDTAFGEVDLGAFVQPGVFTARIENKMSDGFAYDWYTKYDIRYCDSTAMYATFYNFFFDPLRYKVRFYNYVSPIVAKISIFRDNVFLPDSADKGCFCEYNATYFSNPREIYGNGWYITWVDNFGNGGYRAYDKFISPSLVDTINLINVEYYTLEPLFVIVGIDEHNNLNNEYRIFPTPVVNEVNINHPENETFDFYINDMEGKIKMEGVLYNHHINCKKLKTGIYTLVIYNKQTTIKFKLIKL
ncbi:MAG: hypothetical protein BWX95_02240 [Bacteroidetes bacterium ADurb.Bin141]|nr:MAG: hypothetical protein BWX95_02240 [Bacteroidetes bacterium ADurb.Bin141]